MKLKIFSLLTTVMVGLFMVKTSAAATPDNTLYLQLANGTVEIEMLPDVAPKHVAQIKALVREKFYDGIVFHRVMDGFMAQAGDPTGTGAGGSDKADLPAEFSDISHTRGIVSMARKPNDVNSANSQFFIVLADSTFLDNQYTVWGRVTKGMELVDQIKKGSGPGGMVTQPDKIISMKLASDAK